MLWLDGANEILGRRKELDSLYTLLMACHRAPDVAESTLAGVSGAWQRIAAFLLDPVPELVDHLRIPANLSQAEGAEISAAVSDWGACVEERVRKERSLSEEWDTSGRPEDAMMSILAELQLLRDQCERTGFLLRQLELPRVHETLTWARAQDDGQAAAERVMMSKPCLIGLHHEAIERSRGLSQLLAG